MDSFAESVMERAKRRGRMLQEISTTENIPKSTEDRSTATSEVLRDGNSSPKRMTRSSSKTRISSTLPGSPQRQPNVLNIQRDNFNMEIKLLSSDGCRVEVEIEEETDDNSANSDNPDAPMLREQAKNKLRRLGKLYGSGEEADISSPIHRTENMFSSEENQPSCSVQTTKLSEKSRKGLRKLADLAENINQWDDDLSKRKTEDIRRTPQKTKPKTNYQSPAKSRMIDKTPVCSPVKSNVVSQGESAVKTSSKQLKWDKSVLDNLESQGFTRTESQSKLVYNFKNSQEAENHRHSQNSSNSDSEHEGEIEQSLQKAEIVVQKIISKPFTPLNIQREQEKVTPRSPVKTKTNIGGIANRAAMFETPKSPVKTSSNLKDPALLTVSERKALFEKNRGEALMPKVAFGMSTPVESSKSSTTTEKTANINKNRSTFQKTTSQSTSQSTSKGTSQSTSKSTSRSLAQIISQKSEHTVDDSNKISPKKTSTNKQVATRRDDEIIKSNLNDAVLKSSGKQTGGGIADRIAAFNNKPTTISQQQIEDGIREHRKNDMDLLLGRFQKNKQVYPDFDSDEDNTESTETSPKSAGEQRHSTSAPQKRKSGEIRQKKGDSPQVQAVLDDVKRIRVSGPKDGRLYPCLSDIEANTETEVTTNPSTPDDSYSENEDINTSFGRDILQAVCHKENSQPKVTSVDNSIITSASSDVSYVLDEMDEFLNEEYEDSEDNAGPTPSKLGKLSHTDSFQYSSKQPLSPHNYKSPVKVKASPVIATIKSPIAKKVSSPRKSTELPSYVVDGNDVMPLQHTVSFYRKQHTPNPSTPVRKVVRIGQIDEESVSSEETAEIDNLAIEEKIQELKYEVEKQEKVIAQSSQALNLCNSRLEFNGSTEQVEAEKLLLIATNRRQAALYEIGRIQVERSIQPKKSTESAAPEKGSLTISNIVLPLKKEYVRALAAAGGKGHHLVCLAKSGYQVSSTKLVSTVATSVKNPDLELIIPGNVRLENIYSDSTVTFEVYCLQAHEEILPHEVKYHIKKTGNKLTPKKMKQDTRMTCPPMESPGGPHAVRSSTFALMGYVVFSIQAANKKQWTLNKAPSMSPLVGSVEMKISCELEISVEKRGFLTMFEDISGFGAWHRRWCLVKGHTVSYWKYPDDERKKAPIDTLNLKTCVNEQIGLVPREICARLHTLLIELERPAMLNDTEVLTTICKGDKTVVRHLLSADSKEDRVSWCTEFNKALTAIKVWNTPDKC